MAFSGPQKSTIVRAATRLSFRTLDLVAPALGARLVERIWFRIPRGMPLVEPSGTPFEVRWSGRTIRGQVWGEGAPVYLVHGWGGNGDQMRHFVEPLVAAGHRVVAYDGPSHGRSDPGAHGPESSDAVELGRALDAVVAEFGPAHAVVAHSLGTLSLLLALRDGWCTAERVVLIAPIGGVPSLTAYFRAVLGFGDRTERHSDRRVRARTGYDPDDLQTLNLAAGARASALVVQDRDDRTPAVGIARELASRWPDAAYVETNGLGHNRVLADPEVVATVVGFVTGAAPIADASAEGEELAS